jgi:DNA-binding NarL/FixJ family response regulator
VATSRASLRAAVSVEGPFAALSRPLVFALAGAGGVARVVLEARGWMMAEEPFGADVVVVESDRAHVLEAVDALAEKMSGLPIAVVLDEAAAGDRVLVRDLVGRGVKAIVSEPRVESALAVSIEAALAGQIALPAEIGGAARPMLTSREKQVLAMIVLSFTNGEIAQKLYVSESTVKSHLSSAFAKLGVRSRREAAELILDPVNGLGTGILAIVGDDSDIRHRPPSGGRGS